ncbi:SRPBCC family protein [Maribacter sp. 2308TA10-17]|uniref:SRPBCC family protein n=1 Tax=Maribacter sp. 2308TA10-17 TaxID=3386276 RepID=UPI0039BCBFAB
MEKHKIIILTLLAVSISNFVAGQTSKKLKISNSIEMNNGMDEVWTAISNLGNLDRLVPEIIERTEMVGNGEGSIVTLILKSNGARVVESITKLDNKKRIISYEMLETPMPMSYYKATISIVSKNSDTYNIRFEAILKTEEENKETMFNTIDNFQKTLLYNVKNIYNEK